MSTDWIEVHDQDSVYETKVFLSNDDKAYMITIQNDKKRFFKVDANLLKSGEQMFFKKVMGSAKELSKKQTVEMGLVRKEQLDLFHRFQKK